MDKWIWKLSFSNCIPFFSFSLCIIFIKVAYIVLAVSFPHYNEILKPAKSNLMAIVFFVILLYFFEHERVSRLVIGIYAILSTLTLVMTRILFRNTVTESRKRGKNIQRTLLVGNGHPLKEYVDLIYSHQDSGITFVGHVDPGDIAENKIKIFENYQQAKEQTSPDVVLLSYRGKDSWKNTTFLATHYNDVTPIKFLPNISHSLIGHQIEDFEGIPMLSINAPSFNGMDIFLKRCFDIVGSLFGLILLSPLFLVISIFVKLSSPGPVFYGQKRIGLGGRPFTIWKFRTMRMSRSSEDQEEWSQPDNPRKTVLGNLLRRTSLDELPQLWNVLKGEMCLIGPRPEQPYFVEQFKKNIPGYMLRHKMKPGISGWAQINGWRGDTDLEKRIECDIYYIKNWSLWPRH